jgi:hypothetical protein
MTVMTGIEGTYNPAIDRYCQPREYATWKEVVLKNKIQLEVASNLMVLPSID